MKHRYNWKPDTKDHRDHIMKLTAPAALPPKVDLRANCSPVFDQGDEGSCTAHAGAGLFEYLQLEEIKKNNPGPEIFVANQYTAASRQFIYWCERDLDGTTDQDSGAQIRDCVKAMATFGVCREKIWPYTSQNMYIKPGDVAYADAVNHKITTYTRLVSHDQMKACLANGYPFMFGIFVYQSLESEEVAATGKVPMPQPDEQCIGGHAIMCVGYDDTNRWFIIRNSWGPSWGDGGYFYLPYAYVENPNLAEDFWVIRR